MSFVWPILRHVYDNILDGSVGRILQSAHDLRIGRNARIQDQGAGIRAWRAKAVFGAAGPVAETPLPYVGITLMYPDICIVAAQAQIVMTDDFHVEGLFRICAAAVSAYSCWEYQDKQCHHTQ